MNKQAQASPRRFESLTPLQHAQDHLICFSHLRWDFVFQRPQHLMTRFAEKRRVVFFEEPIGCAEQAAHLETRRCPRSGVIVATPYLPETIVGEAGQAVLRSFVDQLLVGPARNTTLWVYSPMFFPLVSHIEGSTLVYDCMDELAQFRFAPRELPELERRLLKRADVVFTGGHSLFEAKRAFHPNIHPFPSSVDTAHFAAARAPGPDPDDQASIPHPRLGFYGVIDERLDLGLIASLAVAHPEWQVVMVGPVVKIDPATLPRASNVHYLGAKSYDELPSYVRGWDATMMPFALNEATRFISPTKTLEFLAAGRPVVSTPVADVVRQYRDLESVRIAADVGAFVTECGTALAMSKQPDRWLPQVDAMLAEVSWQKTFEGMTALIDRAAVGARPELIDTIAGRTPMSIRVRGRATNAPADVLVVGAGFAGSVMAERLAAQFGKRVLVIDRRPHVAGNAHDLHDAAGVLMHAYGPHIFHTNSDEIFSYLSRFTKWRPYEHRVLARVAGMDVPMPINRVTLNRLYGLTLSTDEEAARYLAERAEPVAHVRTSEDVVVSKVGRDLYEKFFRGYTRKQWGMDPSELDKSVAARVPARVNTDDRYFTDAFQFMPLHGYTRMFENMLDHELIEVQTGVDYKDVVIDNVFDHVVFTGPIDEFFDFRFGKLPYRSLRFQHVTLDRPNFQPVGTVNYPDEAVPYTRVSEYKHLTGQTHPRTTLTYEYPSAEGDPYYPVPRAENQALFKQYEALARAQSDVTFVGRLATYRYYNMDQVVGQSLSAAKALGRRWGAAARESASASALAAGE